MFDFRSRLGLALLVVMAGAPAAAQDLASLAAEAAESHPEIVAQRAAVRSLEARAWGARGARLPTLNISGTVERRRLVIDGTTGPDAEFDARQADLETRLPLFRGFQLQNTIDLREAELRSGRDALKATENSVLYDLAAAYADVLRDERIAASARLQKDTIQGQLDGARRRFELGDATRTDVQQAEARAAVAAAGVVAADESLAVSRSAFARLAGRPPETLAPLPALTGLPSTLDEALAASASSPRLRAAQANADAAREATDVARGGLLPSLDAVAGVQYLSGGAPNAFTGQLPNDRTASYGGVQVRVPIFQGGTEYAEIARARAVRSQRLAQVALTEREVSDSVREAWVRWTASRQTIEASRAAVAANEAAAEGVRREAIGGARTLLDVLDAQNELLNARVGLERAVRNEFVARAALLAALGRLSPDSFRPAA